MFIQYFQLNQVERIDDETAPSTDLSWEEFSEHQKSTIYLIFNAKKGADKINI